MADENFCNAINCDVGTLDIESVLLSLFAKDANGCIGLKLGWIQGSDCSNLESLAECTAPLTVEQALKMSIVSDGCDGWALGMYFVYPAGD